MARQLSLYIHIPYCTVRCGYCDFNTYTPKELGQEDGLEAITSNYLDSLLTEIDLVVKQVGKGLVVPTIFIGGGTPSLVSPKNYHKLFAKLKESFELNPDCEITMEANPDSLTKESLTGYLEVGINRLSIGAQSYSPHVLQTLNRTHHPENVKNSVQLARQVGFNHINVDLIYGTPGETLDDWKNTLTITAALDIDHISAYALIVEEGTKLAREINTGVVANPDDDLMADKYLFADSYLKNQGFEWYELSNWAKSDGQCKHNLAYWQSKSWWGLGPGAHSYFDHKRFSNLKNPLTYSAKVKNGELPIATQELQTDEMAQVEKIMLEIRLRSGLEISALPDPNLLGDLDKEFFLPKPMEDGRLVLSPTGRLMADSIVRKLSAPL